VHRRELGALRKGATGHDGNDKLHGAVRELIEASTGYKKGVTGSLVIRDISNTEKSLGGKTGREGKDLLEYCEVR